MEISPKHSEDIQRLVEGTLVENFRGKNWHPKWDLPLGFTGVIQEKSANL